MNKRGGETSPFFSGNMENVRRILVLNFFYLGDRMRRSRNSWFAFLILFFYFPVSVFAAAVPVYSGKMNQATGSIIDTKLQKMGFAANDPRISSTLFGVSTGLTTLAVGVGTGAVAAVGWPVLLAGAGISAVVAGGVALASGKLTDWIWGDGNQAKLSGSDLSGPSASDLPPVPASVIDILNQSGTGKDVYYKDSQNRVLWFKTINVLCTSSCLNPPAPYNGPLSSNFSTPFSGPWDRSVSYWSNSYIRSGVQSNSFDIVFAYSSKIGETVLPPTYISQFKTIPQIIADVPNSVVTSPLTDQMLAASVNAAWKSASSQNPDMIPWSSSNPVTPTDVQNWRAANPTLAPTVNDFIGPVAPQGAITVPITNPSSSPSPQPSPPPSPGVGTQVDLGPDPNTVAPVLEATPTAQQILSPIFNLMPSLKNFAVPAHQSECPKPSFNLWNKTHTFESQCTLFESNRALIAGFMLLFWTITATVIVLRA